MLSLDEIVGLLKASGEPTRLRLLALLAEGDLSVKDLTAILHQSQPRISRHLKLLYESGLVERLPEGAWVYYCLTRDKAKGGLIAAALRHLDPEDAMILRDRDRLKQIKDANTQQATDYFKQNAEHWDELRVLHVPESAVEQAILEALGDQDINQLLDLGTGTGSILSLLADRCHDGLGWTQTARCWPLRGLALMAPRTDICMSNRAICWIWRPWIANLISSLFIRCCIILTILLLLCRKRAG